MKSSSVLSVITGNQNSLFRGITHLLENDVAFDTVLYLEIYNEKGDTNFPVGQKKLMRRKQREKSGKMAFKGLKFNTKYICENMDFHQ